MQGGQNYAPGEPVSVHRPDELTSPLVFASPHSGRVYPEAFVQEVRVPLSVLRRSEDAFVDTLFEGIPGLGAPLICANFPRVYVDPNRARDELDPGMFVRMPANHEPLPTARASAGLGVIPRVAADGRSLYGRRLSYDEAVGRLAACYSPFHRAVEAELATARARFGRAILIDCHSMPAASARGADIVLGDRYGASCSAHLISLAEQEFRALGFAVVRNRPYAGGYSTEHYGKPESGVEALQIEINRGLYLNELDTSPCKGFNALQTALSTWAQRLIFEHQHGRIAAE